MLSLAPLLLAAPVCAQVPAAAEGRRTPSFDQQDLWVSGVGSHTYRIPALAVMPSGTLVAVADARRDNSSDLPGNIDVVMRRSFDGGRTWTPQAVIQDLPQGHGAGDPSLLVDSITNRLFCFFAYGPPGIGFNSSQAGSNDPNDPNTLHAHVIWSDDDGATWSPARDLNPEIKDPSWRALFASSGNGIQLRSGRLVQPYAVKHGNGSTSSRNAYSDDHGATWQMGAAAGLNTNESKAVELGFGIVMQNLRHNSVAGRFIALSFDGGHSFSPMSQDPNLIDPRVNAGLAVIRSRANGDRDDLLAFTNPWSTAGRTDLEVRLSMDEGTSWPRSRLVNAGPSAYSTLAALPSGEIGLLYERGVGGAYEKITFARFTEAWVDERPRLLDSSGRPNPDHPDLWCWLDASTLGLSEGDAVAAWPDRATHGAHGLPRSTDGPGVFRASATAGRPAVQLVGDADLWGAAAGEFGALEGPLTIVLVARVDASAGTGYVLDKSTGAGGLGLRVAGGRFEVHAERTFGGSAVDVVVPSASFTRGEWHVHTLRLDGDVLEHFVDGSLAASANLGGASPPLGQRGLILGADFRTENDGEVWIAEVIALRGALDASTQAALVAGLRTRYGI